MKASLKKTRASTSVRQRMSGVEGGIGDIFLCGLEVE